MTFENLDFSHWQQSGYEVVLTGDGSPTLRTLKSPSQETMHHRGGAYSETQLIYGEALREVLDQGGRKILSVGLGLAYNEILIASECLIRDIQPDEVLIETLEIDPELQRGFLNFIEGKELGSKVYHKICEFFLTSSNQGLSTAKIQNWLKQSLVSEKLRIGPPLGASIQFKDKFQLIFYDAFSSKTDPELWSEDFLTQLWQKIADPDCVVSTYACTGAFKRSLRCNDFKVEVLQGFQSKRDRTLARRGFNY
jgi:hypothetical protein